MKACTIALTAISLCMMPLPALGDDVSPLLETWYTALFNVDRSAFSTLLADGAVIRLEDLAIEQTREEFIESLDAWEEASKESDFAWQADPDGANTASVGTALVCYRFPDNTIMTRETFRFVDGKVVESVQKGIGDSCDDF